MKGANLSVKDNFTIKAIALFILATIALYLLTQHRAHLLANSSFILLSGFILLHVFICGGHGEHRGHGNSGEHEKHYDVHDQGNYRHKEAEEKESHNAGRYKNTHQYKHIQKKLT